MEELVAQVADAISKHGHYHQRTVSAHRHLSRHLLQLLPTANDKTSVVQALWKWCQYGPFDSRRRLLGGGVGRGEAVSESILEAIGVQAAVVGSVGGRLHNDLLRLLNLPANNDNGQLIGEEELFAINAVHFGDLFRYLHQYTTDTHEKQAYRQAAINCYQSVTVSVPECGLAWNQLGVLTVNDCLKAVFYYTKALSVGQPFAAALTNLKSLLRKVDLDKEPMVVRMAAERLILDQTPYMLSSIETLSPEERHIIDFLKKHH